jgi:hypothetical protein
MRKYIYLSSWAIVHRANLITYTHHYHLCVGYFDKVWWTLVMMLLLLSCKSTPRLLMHAWPLLLNGWWYRWTNIVQRFVRWLHAQCISCNIIESYYIKSLIYFNNPKINYDKASNCVVADCLWKRLWFKSTYHDREIDRNPACAAMAV